MHGFHSCLSPFCVCLLSLVPVVSCLSPSLLVNLSLSPSLALSHSNSFKRTR